MYIYKCTGVTVQITGKLKSVILDSCTKCGVIFDTAISACEVVNCKSVQVQSTNVCPSFSIDKTDGCVVHLTNEAIGLTSFVTSKSSEMNGESFSGFLLLRQLLMLISNDCLFLLYFMIIIT